LTSGRQLGGHIEEPAEPARQDRELPRFVGAKADGLAAESELKLTSGCSLLRGERTQPARPVGDELPRDVEAEGNPTIADAEFKADRSTGADLQLHLQVSHGDVASSVTGV